MRLFFLVFAILLVSMSVCMAAEMPPFSAVKADMDKAIHQQMKNEGLVESSNVDWLAGRIRKVNKIGEVYVVSGSSVRVSPSNIYLGSEVVSKASNGTITGIILCASYVIQNGGMEKRYDQVARSVNAFAMGSKNDPSSEANTKMLQEMAFKIVDFFERDTLISADAMACKSLPDLGYSASGYIDYLKSISGSGMGSAAKIFSNLPDRISALEKLGPWPEVKDPAPKSQEEEANNAFQKTLKFTDRITEVDPTPYLSAFEGKPVEGYCSGKLTSNIVLLLNRTGKVAKKSKGGFLKNYVLGDGESSVDSYYLDDGKKNKATEAIFLLKNPFKDRSFFLITRLGADVGTANLPKEYQNDMAANDRPEAHGDWVYKEYLAIRMNVEDLKGDTQFQLGAFIFRKAGDETGQLTSKDAKIRPQVAKSSYYLSR